MSYLKGAYVKEQVENKIGKMDHSHSIKSFQWIQSLCLMSKNLNLSLSKRVILLERYDLGQLNLG